MLDQNNHPLHPLSFDLMQRAPRSKQQVHQEWMKANGGDFAFTGTTHFSELPLIASTALQQQLQTRVLDLCHTLKPRLKTQSLHALSWLHAPDADVLTVDYAVVEAPHTTCGWEIRLVEFQAFPSLIAMVHLLEQSHQILWPELNNMPPWVMPTKDHSPALWKQACEHWQAGIDGTILLEYQPHKAGTYFDLQATSRLWQIPIVEPRQLKLYQGKLIATLENGKTIEVSKILNRLILSDLPTNDSAIVLLKEIDQTIQWHGHPAWYYAMHKGIASELSLKTEPRNVRADDWRALGLSAEKLVAKNIYSCGGKDLLLSPSAAQLDALHQAHDWIVQPRYKPYPIITAQDGAPIFAEMRLIVNIKNLDTPWIAAQIARLYRGDSASAGLYQGRPGEGTTLLHSAPL